MSDKARLRRVGAIWKPRPLAKHLGSGEISIDGQLQRFIVMRNDRKKSGSRQPDYVLLSSEEPVDDPYERNRQAAPPRDDTGEAELSEDDIPF